MYRISHNNKSHRNKARCNSSIELKSLSRGRSMVRVGNFIFVGILFASLSISTSCSQKKMDDVIHGATKSGEKEELLDMSGYDRILSGDGRYKTSTVSVGDFATNGTQAATRYYAKKAYLGVEEQDQDIYVVKFLHAKNEYVEAQEELVTYLIGNDKTEHKLLAKEAGFVVSIKKTEDKKPVGDSTKLVSFANAKDCLISMVDMGQQYRYLQSVEVEASIQGETITCNGQVASLSESQLGYTSIFDARANVDLLCKKDEKNEASHVYVKVEDGMEQVYKSNSYQVNSHPVQLSGVVLVKKTAVYLDETNPYVLILADGVIRKQYLVLGSSDNSYYCVVDGLQEGMTIVEN